jgi:hypothetical protein
MSRQNKTKDAPISGQARHRELAKIEPYLETTWNWDLVHRRRGVQSMDFNRELKAMDIRDP